MRALWRNKYEEFLEFQVIRGNLWCLIFGICGLAKEGGLEIVEGPPTSMNGECYDMKIATTCVSESVVSPGSEE